MAKFDSAKVHKGHLYLYCIPNMFSFWGISGEKFELRNLQPALRHCALAALTWEAIEAVNIGKHQFCEIHCNHPCPLLWILLLYNASWIYFYDGRNILPCREIDQKLAPNACLGSRSPKMQKIQPPSCHLRWKRVLGTKYSLLSSIYM